MGNFNITSGEKNSTNFHLTDTAGQIAPGQYGEAGYIVKSGFQYIYADSDFTFTLSNTSLALGLVTPGVFSQGQTSLGVTTHSASGYIVYAQEEHPLKNPVSASVIPDTTCDTSTCSETTAAAWGTASNTGFGFTATGNDVLAAFAGGTAFKQFADASLSEAPQAIMQNTGTALGRIGTVTYQLSVDGSQAAGNYETVIKYIATPGY